MGVKRAILPAAILELVLLEFAFTIRISGGQKAGALDRLHLKQNLAYGPPSKKITRRNMATQSVGSFQKALTASANTITKEILEFLPVVIGALVIVAIGFILGGWLKTLLTKALEVLNLSKLTKNTAITKFLDNADIKGKIEEVLGEVIRWLTILIFFIAAVNILGLTPVSTFLMSVLAYIPKVVAASLVLAAGALIGGWVESLIKGAVGTASLATGRLLGKIAGYTVVVFAILAAISELGIAERFINTLFIGFVAMLSLGLGLSFGLGAKDIVAKLLDSWYKELKKDLK